MIYGNISNCKVYNGQTRSEYQCRLGYEVLSEDTAKNQRRVKLQLEVRSISSNYSTYGYNQTSIIDGYQLAAASFDTRNTNAWQIFGTREITIDGAFYGTKTASFTTNANSSWLLKSGSASVDINLDNLHTPPVITSVSMVEKNTLLENAAQIVQHLSVKNITIETTTYDDATISSYQVHHNGVLIGSSTSNGMTIDFNNVGTLATFEMNGKMYCTLKFVVIDSFGTSSFIETQFEVIQYVKPNLVQTSSSIKRNGQLTGKVKLNLVGTFYNNKANDIQNTMRLEFAYWKKGENESTTYYEIPYNATDDNVSLWNWNVAINGEEITDVDKDFAYVFSVRLIDYFNQGDQILLLCPVGEYVWAEFKNRVDFKKLTIENSEVAKGGKNDPKLLLNSSDVIEFEPIVGEDWAFYGGCYYYKIGTKVHIHIGIGNVTTNTHLKIFTMPQGYRPLTTLGGVGIDDALLVPIGWQLTKEGELHVSSRNGYVLVDIEYDAFN